MFSLPSADGMAARFLGDEVISDRLSRWRSWLWGRGLSQGFPGRLITLGLCVLCPVYPDPQKTKINTQGHQDLVENSQKLALKNPYFLRLLLSLCLGHCLVLFKVCDVFQKDTFLHICMPYLGCLSVLYLCRFLFLSITRNKPSIVSFCSLPSFPNLKCSNSTVIEVLLGTLKSIWVSWWYFLNYILTMASPKALKNILKF